MDRESLEEDPIGLVDSNEELARTLEGLLFAAGHEGLTSEQIADVLDIAVNQVPRICNILDLLQENEARAFRLHMIGGTWQLLTQPYLSPFLKKMATAPSLPGLSQAALEILAIIAFRQPITRVEIDQIRGVKSDRALGTLLSRGLIVETGRAEGPGRPILYGTSKDFMDYFGLSSLQDIQLPMVNLEIE
jgi:segregation and condensation protein B